MKLKKSKYRTVSETLDTLQQESVITNEQKSHILDHIEPLSFDWKRLARFSFIIAIICTLISFSTLLGDAKLLEAIIGFFMNNQLLLSGFVGMLSAAFFYGGWQYAKRFPLRIFSTETIHFFGVILFSTSIGLVADHYDLHIVRDHYWFLLPSIISLGIAYLVRSKLIWIYALLCIGGWVGASTGYWGGGYFLGMNYPLRFVALGALTLLLSYTFHWNTNRAEFYGPTKVIGLLWLFISLWILSIWGNETDWGNASDLDQLYWSVCFAVASILAIYFSLRVDDGTLRGFGLTFLFINLYTRFFEYFWDDMHKALFFAILAATLYLIASKAEQIWSLNISKKKATE